MMTNEKAIAIVNEFIRRQEEAGGNSFVMPDGFDEALRIVSKLAWKYGGLHE